MQRFAIVVMFLALVWLSSDRKDLQGEVSSLRFQLSVAEGAQNRCEDNLADATDRMYEASTWAWSSYEDMGYALDDLSYTYYW